MDSIRNVLFIMCDQLRADYLACYGHPTIKTPNIDALAERGVSFHKAYCSAPTCGPSRMSFYTGRSMASHGAVWNFAPYSIHEHAIGDFLEPHGIQVALAGKTHFAPDRAGIKRLGIDISGANADRLLQGGFHVVERYEGHSNPGVDHPYTRFLREHGYGGDDPWEDFVQSGIDERGELASGWLLRNVHLPARVDERHSETAYTTDVAIDYIKRRGDDPWLLHVSYIKPHWPYLAPAPYHAMYGDEDCLPFQRSASELKSPHPVYGAYLQHRECRSFSADNVATKVKRVYMGLVSQLDNHIGRLLAALKEVGRDHDTLIVLTADHGDYLGDHWLGEKDLFHDPSARIPYIIVDPRPSADEARGRHCKAPVEGSLDFIPTAMDALGVRGNDHLLEGRSLMPFVCGEERPAWRPAAVCELDYSFREARLALGQHKRKCRGYMVRSGRWKYIFWEGFRHQLFDMENDPHELRDLGGDPDRNAVAAEHRDYLFDWLRDRHLSVTLRDEQIVISRYTLERRLGIGIGAI